MANGDTFSHVDLSSSDVALLKKLAGDLPILADVSRADLMLFCQSREGRSDRAVIVAQAMPHATLPVYEDDRVGLVMGSLDHAEVIRGLRGHLHTDVVHTISVRGATVARQVYPVRNTSAQLIAVLVKDSFWLAHERQRRRSKVFQDALERFIEMVLRGELKGAELLSPFGEHDGVVYVGVDRRIRYMSGIAAGLYRKLGYRDSLIDRRISELETVDHQMVTQAINEQRAIQRQTEQYGFTWVRKALPVIAPDESPWTFVVKRLAPGKAPTPRPQGVLILVHDATGALEAQRELESKMALIREVHHRVKNNLQVIASLMRMQARRAQTGEAKEMLEESVNRILSVAVVHEFLSQNASGTINVMEVAHRILSQVQQGLIDPTSHIQLRVRGSDIWLPAERATQCALVINELVQNAIEHGLAQQNQGRVEVSLADDGERVRIQVTDNGVGLPEGFELSTSSNLGLRIVRSLVERDLRGRFELTASTEGTHATVEFDKSVLGGT